MKGKTAMHKIAESTVLLRGTIELPCGIKLARDGFQEGWEFLKTGNARRLERKIQKRGWHFIKFEGSSVRSGVGDSVELALASAVKLALRRVSVFFNAVEIQHIQITSYPWFVLARIIVNSYRIQQAQVEPVPDQFAPAAAHSRKPKWPEYAGELYPQFGSAMPLLKQLLIAPRNQEARPQ
jgi:hypothetical protein